MAGRARHTQQLDDERRAHRVYSARWADLRAQGEKPVVINRRQHPEQWSAWLAYFHAHGLAMLVEMMADKPDKTVPTWWPHDFDVDTDPPPRRDPRMVD
jgi:hypothetical protein